MTVPATALSLTGDGLPSRASAGELLNLASSEDFARWEQQLAATRYDTKLWMRDLMEGAAYLPR